MKDLTVQDKLRLLEIAASLAQGTGSTKLDETKKCYRELLVLLQSEAS